MFLFALGAVVSALAKQVRGQSGFLRAVELDPHQVPRAIESARLDLEEELRAISMIRDLFKLPGPPLPLEEGLEEEFADQHAGVKRQLEELKSFEEGWITGTPETMEQLQKISALAKQGQPEAAGQMLLALIPLWGSSLEESACRFRLPALKRRPRDPPRQGMVGPHTFQAAPGREGGGLLWDMYSTSDQKSSEPGSQPLDYIGIDERGLELAGLLDEYTEEHAVSDALRYAVVAGGHPTIAHLSPQSIYMAVAATLTAHVLWARELELHGEEREGRPTRSFLPYSRPSPQYTKDRLRLFYDWVEEARSSATSSSGSIG